MPTGSPIETAVFSTPVEVFPITKLKALERDRLLHARGGVS